MRSEGLVAQGAAPREDFADGRPAFGDTHDLRFFYVNDATEAVRDGLISDVLARKGLRLLVGAPGTGKTMLLLDVKRKLEAVNCLVVLSRGTRPAFEDLLDACCDELGMPEAAGTRMERIRALAELLVQRLEAGATTALLIDDAQALSDDALEDLSWLTDLEKGGHKLVQIVLAGQPDLVPRLCGSRLMFVQNSAIEYSGLKPLSPQEVGEYIRHRLNAADCADADLFSTEAADRIAAYAEGLPRAVNRFCAAALQLAARTPGGLVSAGTVDEAARTLASAPQSDAPIGDAGDGPIAAEALLDGGAALEADGAWADGRPAATGSCDAAEPEAPIDIPAQPTADDGSADEPGASPDDAAGIAPELPERPPFHGDLRSDPILAPFPRNLTIPPPDIRPARRRGSAAMIAVLFLAGLVLGGAGVFYFRDASWLPDGAPWMGTLLSDGGRAPATPSTADGARRAATASAPRPQVAPEPRPQVAAAAVEQPARKPPAASAPTLDVAPASGREDQAIPLDIRASTADAAMLVVAVSGLPDGARLSAGRDGGNGMWSLGREDLTGLKLTPAPDFSGELRLMVDASARWPDGTSRSASRTLIVKVAGAADRPILDVAEAKGKAQEAIPLDIYAAPADRDGSESLSVAISGLPDGARLSAGSDDGAGGWRLAPRELMELALTPPASFAGRIALTVVATAREADGDSASATAVLNVDVTRPAPVVAHAKGDFVLQLAALRSVDDAEREVARLKQRFQSLLGDAPLKIYEAEVNGVPYYRVRTEPVPDKAEIFQICARLKESQQDCMVLQQIAEAKPALARSEAPPAGPLPVSLLPRETTLAQAEPSAPKPAAPAADRDISVRELVLAREVVDREPAEVTTTFSPQDHRAFAHAKIYNPGAPTEVSFVWLYDDALYATVDMKVGTSVRWRTWSSAEVWLGKWRVQVVSADGQVLAENDFTVQ